MTAVHVLSDAHDWLRLAERSLCAASGHPVPSTALAETALPAAFAAAAAVTFWALARTLKVTAGPSTLEETVSEASGLLSAPHHPRAAVAPRDSAHRLCYSNNTRDRALTKIHINPNKPTVTSRHSCMEEENCYGNRF